MANAMHPHAEDLARLFHETYERIAPRFGYETRPESRVAWDDVPEANKATMIATCTELLEAGHVTMAKSLHDWTRSTLGHGALMCKRCHMTDREAVALGVVHRCEGA